MNALRYFLLAISLFVPGPAALAEGPFDGHWEGAIRLPAGELEFDVDLETAADGALSGDISIPAQGLRDMALAELADDDGSIRFKMPGVPGDPTFDGNLSEDGGTISGTFRQGGAELAFELARVDRRARIDAALEGFGALAERAVANFNVPGLAIAIVAGGEVVYAEGFGFRDLEAQKPMTADTLFAIGSTTKAMTATVLGMLVDEGKLEWDEPLVRFLPSFRLADPMITVRVTPRDLVSHRSGLPRHDLLWYNNHDATREEMVARLAHLELTADLREKFQYNNLMFMTAGYLAGQLDGRSWEETMRVRLFDPLGMARTNFSVEASQRDTDHALPYRENDDDRLERIPFRRIDLVGPAGSVNSSVREMSRWLLFNLDQGKAGDRKLIEPATLADVQSPHMTIEGRPRRTDVSQASYGLGWLIDAYRGHRRLHHGGGIDGFVTSVMLFPDDDLGLVAFTNRDSGMPALLNQHATDRILGLEEVDWIGEALAEAEKGEAVAEEAKKKKDAARVAGTSPSHPIADYAGSYSHPGYGMLEIAVAEADDHALEMTFNGITAPFEHWHYDVWNGAETDGDPTFEDSKLLFRGNYDGLIAEVEAPFELTASPIVFTKEPDARLSDPEYLARFAGTYEEPTTGQKAHVAVSGRHLTLSLPGQPTYTLDPEVSGRFAIAGLAGFSVGFEEQDGKVVKAVFHQPNGVFESLRVEE